ncbi:tyrosine-type recombinase/integrase [Spirillospora sp. NPDC127200]
MDGNGARLHDTFGTPDRASQPVARLRKDLHERGPRRIRLHVLRHATASLKRLGVPPGDAKEILGHARISVTLEIYAHGDNEDHRTGPGRVAGELFGKPGS